MSQTKYPYPFAKRLLRLVGFLILAYGVMLLFAWLGMDAHGQVP